MDERAAIMNSLGPSKPGKKVKKHVHEMQVRRGASGGYVVNHEMRDKEGNHQGTTGPHVIMDKAALHSHMDEHMGDQPPAGSGDGDVDESGLEGEAGPDGEK